MASVTDTIVAIRIFLSNRQAGTKSSGSHDGKTADSEFDGHGHAVKELNYWQSD